jgi:hypothetical protein
MPEQNLYEFNPSLAKLEGEALQLAKRSMALDLEEADEADMKEYNEILWKVIKPTKPMPKHRQSRNNGVKEVLLVSNAVKVKVSSDRK